MTLVGFVGDTQRTTPIERLVGREQNDAPRRRLAAALAGEPLSLLVHLGDLVTWGASARSWAYLDALAAPLRSVPWRVVPGNHDAWGPLPLARRHLRRRFPELGAVTWGLQRVGPLALLLLDTSSLAAGRLSQQRAWFDASLDALDRDPSVASCLVCSHHPPLSHAPFPGSDGARPFVPAFVRARKTRAWLAGHVHAYERFSLAGRAFVVSGGGGGPRVRLRPPGPSGLVDRCSLPSPRPFHYVLLRCDGEDLRFEVKGFQGDEPVRVIDRFDAGVKLTGCP